MEGLVRECDDVTKGSITVHGGWSDPEVIGTPAVVAMVGMDALPVRNDAPFDCGDGGNAWIADNGYRCEIIDGMTITMVVICVIQMNRIGMIRMILRVSNMWTIIILTCRREWT